MAVMTYTSLPAWQELLRLPEATAMADCQQDPLWHAEGDVLVHTRMVVDQLLQDPRLGVLSEEQRVELLAAAALHDVGKPSTSVLVDGHWSAPGHARRGETIARRLLWQMEVDPAARERVCALVGAHMLPPRAIERPLVDVRRRLLELSLRASCGHLGLLSAADVRGRLAQDLSAGVEAVQMYDLLCQDLGVDDGPYPFASDVARVEFFERGDRDPSYAAFDSTRSRAIVMSGLPGAGKDHWIATHTDATVISLDDVRRELGARRGDSRAQGHVLATARERARVLLRAGEPLVWNATNLSQQLRGTIVSLLRDYDAHVTMVAVEAPPTRLHQQNRDRAHPIPAQAIDELVGRWEPPTLAECHELVHVT